MFVPPHFQTQNLGLGIEPTDICDITLAWLASRCWARQMCLPPTFCHVPTPVDAFCCKFPHQSGRCFCLPCRWSSYTETGFSGVRRPLSVLAIFWLFKGGTKGAILCKAGISKGFTDLSSALGQLPRLPPSPRD